MPNLFGSKHEYKKNSRFLFKYFYLKRNRKENRCFFSIMKSLHFESGQVGKNKKGERLQRSFQMRKMERQPWPSFDMSLRQQEN